MRRGAKITVAGAGALGLTTALALADAGAQVTVFDPAGPADNASGVAAGMLAPAFEAVLDAATAGCLYERGDKGAYENITFARFPLTALAPPRAK